MDWTDERDLRQLRQAMFAAGLRPPRTMRVYRDTPEPPRPVIGGDAQYAWVHHKGGPEPPLSIPAPNLGIPRELMEPDGEQNYQVAQRDARALAEKQARWQRAFEMAFYGMLDAKLNHPPFVPAYLRPPNRRRWRGEIRAALGKHKASWRYRYAVAVGMHAAGAKRLLELPEGVVVKQLH